jgi:hypothetical protein
MQNFGGEASWKISAWKIKKTMGESNIKVYVTEVGGEDGRWMELAQDCV